MFKRSKTYMAIPPGATIKEMIDDRGISEAQLAAKIGESEEFVRQLIEGEVELTDAVAGNLATVFEMRSSFWVDMERLYRDDLIKVAEENTREQERTAKKTVRKAKRQESVVQSALAALG